MQEQRDEAQLWQRMASLGQSESLPKEMPRLLYTRLGSLMRFCDYPERLAPFFQHFPASKCASLHLSKRSIRIDPGTSDAHFFLKIWYLIFHSC